MAIPVATLTGVVDAPQAFGSHHLRHGAIPASSAAIILSVRSW
jgi:hypothetical protein